METWTFFARRFAIDLGDALTWRCIWNLQYTRVHFETIKFEFVKFLWFKSNFSNNIFFWRVPFLSSFDNYNTKKANRNALLQSKLWCSRISLKSSKQQNIMSVLPQRRKSVCLFLIFFHDKSTCCGLTT